MKFKFIKIKHGQDLELTINNFIKDKDVVSVKVERIYASTTYTHEVYILY